MFPLSIFYYSLYNYIIRRNRETMRKTLIVPMLEKRITRLASIQKEKLDSNISSLQKVFTKLGGEDVMKISDNSITDDNEQVIREVSYGENIANNAMRRDSKHNKELFSIVKSSKIRHDKKVKIVKSTKELVWFK